MKYTPLLILVSFVLFACQKEVSSEIATSGNNNSSGSTGSSTSTGSSSYYIKCKVNGTSKTFAYYNMAKISTMSGITAVNFIGSTSANNLEAINLAINFTNGAPAVATYSEADGNTDYIVAGVYNQNSTTVIYGAGLIPSSVMPLSITITKKDNTEIDGTFKGAFYKEDVTAGQISSTEYLSLTEGEFKLPIK